MPRNGKGDAPRHNVKKYGKRWDEIFGTMYDATVDAYVEAHKTQRKHRRRRNDRVK